MWDGEPKRPVCRQVVAMLKDDEQLVKPQGILLISGCVVCNRNSQSFCENKELSQSP